MKLDIYRCSCEREKIYAIFKTPKNAIHYYENNKMVAHLCKECVQESFEITHAEYGNYFCLEGVNNEM